MDYWISAAITAFWLGVLSSISPCPLATNIAAISFIGKNIGKPKYVILRGILYTFGRMFAYLFIAFIIINSLLQMPIVARYLQRNINVILGPLLFLVGIYLLELIKLNFIKGINFNKSLEGKFQSIGNGSSFILGALFALSFCPISAGLFFGSLIPLSIKYESGILMPLIFGLGTAIPVVIFAILLGISTNYVAKFYNNITIFEKWARLLTGIIFIIIGLYLIWERLI